jgi:hypothetical protein
MGTTTDKRWAGIRLGMVEEVIQLLSPFAASVFGQLKTAHASSAAPKDSARQKTWTSRAAAGNWDAIWVSVIPAASQTPAS